MQEKNAGKVLRIDRTAGWLLMKQSNRAEGLRS
jgi:hypothetical protein